MVTAAVVLTDSAATMNRATLPINVRIVESLRELRRALSDYDNASELAALADHLEAGGNLRSDAYGHYFALVRAIQNEELGSIRPHLAALARSSREPDLDIAIRMFGLEGFGRSKLRETSLQFASSSLSTTQMGTVPKGAHCRVRLTLSDSIKLIQTGAPITWQALAKVTTEIIAVYGRPRGMMTFDGCSSLERYGAILINMRRQRTALTMAETLVHESAHSLLFALSCNDHRVLNPTSERYASPLRIDLRPLDGIYHAVFVLARMYSFVAEIERNPRAKNAMRIEAREVMEVRRKNFLDGYAVLIENARFTETGRRLLDDSLALVVGSTRAAQASNGL